MEDMDGVEATTQIKKDLPQIKVLMLTSFIEDKEVYRALDAGVDSYILKNNKCKRYRRMQFVKLLEENLFLNRKF